ncbi:unnamed protein product [Parascedosporium putredinis]|uniref:Uncharacterized protein n=1 Tax=Parascedosporium putredinis TaxID=1442378 RepID=A0A9P1MEL5_9PEZI|nr:unnamed protein product [Parascedosporium putredinis]CAI8004862.1 unnamed protein product [Parascedosporium putredinis]
MSALGNWSFTPLVSAFQPTILPNVQFWNVSNNVGLEYQVEVSWPFEWASQDVDAAALAMYVLDGNALGMTATEAWKRRGPSPARHRLPAAPARGKHAEPHRPPSGADDFIAFLDKVLRPFIRSTVFPNVNFTRDALYGHSFGGLFVIYALLNQPELFDTFLTASPAIFWNNGSILNDHPKKPAFRISYGSLEQFPIRRRTETKEDFQFRKGIIETFRMTDNCQELYRRIRNNPRLRDVILKEYQGQDHASVGATSITDGIDYFADW